MKKIEVVAAVIIKDKKIFCARRDFYGEVGGYWEFPGGKIEPNETHEMALVREIKEELNSQIEVLYHLITVRHQYQNFHITLHAYACNLINGDLVLTEHIDSKWLEIDYLEQLDWAPADIPIINVIKKKPSC